MSTKKTGQKTKPATAPKAAPSSPPMAATAPDVRWTDVGALADIPVRGARLVKTPSGCIAVFRTASDEAFAVVDRCPHKAGPLSQGIVHGRSVTCPLHNWVFDLETGKALGTDVGQLKTIPLKITNGMIAISTKVLDNTEKEPAR